MVFGSGLCWSESLVGVFGFWWGLQGFFFGRFLPCLCGLRVGIFGSLIGDCPIRLIFLVFLGPRVASAAFFGGSGVLSQGAGSLCDFLVCLGIPW